MKRPAGRGAPVRGRCHRRCPRRRRRCDRRTTTEFAVDLRDRAGPDVRRARVAARRASVSTAVVLGMGSSFALASYMIVGPWGAALVGACTVFTIDAHRRWSSGCSTARSSRSARSSPARCTWLLGGPVGQPGRDDFPWVLWPVLVADLTHCVATPSSSPRHLAERQGAVRARCSPGTMLKSVVSYLGLRHLRPAHGGALGRCRASGRCRRCCCCSRCSWRAGRSRSSRRGAGLPAHDRGAGAGGRDQGPLHPRPQRAGGARVGDDRARHRDARGPRQRAALRRHAARRRQARRADQAAAEDRRAHRGRVRRDQAAPGARPGDGPRHRVPRRGVRGDPAPPRAARRPRLPDGAAGRRRSRSSPGSSRWPTRSTR